jgi:protein ImuB
MAGPAAIAPQPGGGELIGEVSAAAHGAGIYPGMRLGEALARCPTLALVPGDPVGVAEQWELVLAALEGIGAAVESGDPGLACFDARGLRRLHGGSLDGVFNATRVALRRPARLGSGPSRFCALAGAHRARVRHPEIVRGAEDLAGDSVDLLRSREQTAHLPPDLQRLGIATLGQLAALPRDALADRFGKPGILAHDLAHGRDEPLRPRAPSERLAERLELPEANSGPQLQRALDVLIDRLLARRELRGRTVRSVVLAAALVEGGTWRERVVFREATADAARMRLALGGHLGALPAPAQALALTADGLGPPPPQGDALFDDGEAQRRARLRDAVRQARCAAGPDAALRVLLVDPDSRVPERRAVLTPFER